MLEDFRRNELPILIRLEDFAFPRLGVLRIELVGVNTFLPLESSEGMEADSPSAMLSSMLGVRTGIGRSTDNLEATGRGIGTFSDSLSGLIGHSKPDPRDCERGEVEL